MTGKRTKTEVVLVTAAALALAACRSTSLPPILTPAELGQAVAALSRPLPGSMAVLYRLRVPSSGGLRLSIAARSGSGVLSVSEPFGSLLSTTWWADGETAGVVDMRKGCTLEAGGLSHILGVGSLPLEQATRLLGGRLPATDADSVVYPGGGRVLIEGAEWSCELVLEAAPWRVSEVRDLPPSGPSRWRIDLSRHSASVPGEVRFEHIDGRWAELALVRLQWDEVDELPAVPVRPPCTGEPAASAGGRR